jgi:hypothetical protein
VKRTGFRELPLLWRLQVPFLALMLAVGLLGGLVIVRNLGTRARAGLDTDVSRAFLNARTRIHDRELYVLESANFAANVPGMAEVVGGRNDTETVHLLRSVLALKTDVELLVATDAAGLGVAELTRRPRDTQPSLGVATSWSGSDFVRAREHDRRQDVRTVDARRHHVPRDRGADLLDDRRMPPCGCCDRRHEPRDHRRSGAQ